MLHMIVDQARQNGRTEGKSAAVGECSPVRMRRRNQGAAVKGETAAVDEWPLVRIGKRNQEGRTKR